jgi:hypothetical protein
MVCLMTLPHKLCGVTEVMHDGMGHKIEVDHAIHPTSPVFADYCATLSPLQSKNENA